MEEQKRFYTQALLMDKPSNYITVDADCISTLKSKLRKMDVGDCFIYDRLKPGLSQHVSIYKPMKHLRKKTE